MIDIHAHVLPFVDDGSKSFAQSLEMLKQAVSQGVTDMVLTPHFDKNYKTSKEQLTCTFKSLVSQVKDANININLYLGREIYVDCDVKKLIASDEVLTLNGTKFVLIEFDTNEDFDIAEAVYELTKTGYKPIVAHFERYDYADVSVAEEIKSLGGYIQVNSDSIIRKTKNKYLRKVKNLFKEGLVDFVATDVHEFRKNNIKKAEEYVTKKFGEKVARAVFFENARKIIEG